MPAERFPVLGGLAATNAVPPVSARTYDLDAEAAVLSAVLLRGEAIDEVRALLEPEHFFSEAHRRLFEAACAERDAGRVPDVVTIASRLRAQGRLAQVGGMAYVTEVLNAAPAVEPRRLEAYAKTVRNLWARRRLGILGQRIDARVVHDPADVATLVAQAQASLDELTELLAASEQSARIDAVRDRAFGEIAQSIQAPKRGLRPSGFDRLDRLTGGLHNTLTVIGGRPGMGKTALASCIAIHLARDGRGVYVASLETSQTEVLRRMACAEGRIDLLRAVQHELSLAEWSRLTSAYNDLGTLPIFIDDTPAVRLVELWAKCRRAQLGLAREGHPLACVVVDYVQLMGDPYPGMKREEAVAKNARGLANMARELGVTVLGLRAVEPRRRNARRQAAAALRSSGVRRIRTGRAHRPARLPRCVLPQGRGLSECRRDPNRQTEQRSGGRLCVARV